MEELKDYNYMKSIDQNNRMLNNLRMLNEKLATMKGIMIFCLL
jgi:hypothetical protein